ncbi:MAG TPA: hypothetical protein VFG04_03805 [Planctomycetaceae bacterium]|jgi:hypothetical protein|nr:hypothetical protein [Planctomycetaceae bacterium]
MTDELHVAGQRSFVSNDITGVDEQAGIGIPFLDGHSLTVTTNPHSIAYPDVTWPRSLPVFFLSPDICYDEGVRAIVQMAHD